jgi:hypothetical protein
LQLIFKESIEFMWKNQRNTQMFVYIKSLLSLIIISYSSFAFGQEVTIRTECVTDPMARQEGSRICIPFW